MKNFLLVTDVPFWQQQKGNHQRIAAMIAYFANHFQMTIVFLGIEIPQLQDDRLTVIHVCRHRGLSALAWRLFRFVPGRLQQTIIRLLRTYGRLGALATFIPAPEISPMARLRARKGRRRA